MKICSLQKKILIIKFGGLGDVILSLNAIYSIFNHHNKCKLILLTEEPYNKLLLNSNWFEKIFTIKRSFFYFLDLLKIKNVIDPNEFDFVYDLQTSKRSSSYLKIFYKTNAITNGIGKYAKIPHLDKNRNKMHTLDRQKSQIEMSEVDYLSKIDIEWLFKSKFTVPKTKFVIIVPGGSKKRLNKRIPKEIFLKITDFLLKSGFKVLIVGSADDFKVCNFIESIYPDVINCCNKTDFFDIGKLSLKSSLSIGNDTGPMHLISRGGKKTMVLFTEFSDPQLCKPVGKNVSTFIYLNDDDKFYKKIIFNIKSNLSL